MACILKGGKKKPLKKRKKFEDVRLLALKLEDEAMRQAGGLQRQEKTTE